MALRLFALFRGFGSWKKQTKDKEEDKKIPIIHKNNWIWGTTYNIIIGSGKAIIKLSVDKEEPNTGTLSGLSVLPEYRKLWYGSKVLEEAIKLAIDLGLEFLELSAEKIPENEWLLEWYQKEGFSKLPDCDSEYTEFMMYLKENEGNKGIIAKEKAGDTTET